MLVVLGFGTFSVKSLVRSRKRLLSFDVSAMAGRTRSWSTPWFHSSTARSPIFFQLAMSLRSP
ncbi:hypothetical protein DDE05_15550 [Streptomyces cavourensis]|nr:hypothetical protein DDE05_15550 [Streptomyces cavourensis]